MYFFFRLVLLLKGFRSFDRAVVRATALLAVVGVTFGDLGGDESPGCPEGEGPGDADDGCLDRGGGDGGDEDGREHTGYEEEVGEEPGAAQGQMGDLQAVKQMVDVAGRDQGCEGVGKIGG